jgi:hypothetical protein
MVDECGEPCTLGERRRCSGGQLVEPSKELVN